MSSIKNAPMVPDFDGTKKPGAFRAGLLTRDIYIFFIKRAVISRSSPMS